jgi:hypothetical protein
VAAVTKEQNQLMIGPDEMLNENCKSVQSTAFGHIGKQCLDHISDPQ